MSNYFTPANQLLGFEKDANGKLVIEQEGAKVVKAIYAMFLNDNSPSKIAVILNSSGATTVQENPWQSTSVLGILRNEKYCGAVVNQKVPSNPCDKVVMPSMRQDEVKHLSGEEMAKLVLALPETTAGRASALILMTGLRSAEIAGLRWGDIDFENAVLQVRRTAHYQKTISNGVASKHQTLVISPAKTRKGFRELALMPQAMPGMGSLDINGVPRYK
jgi:hypothetical protein